jgi:hypothetical protein
MIETEESSTDKRIKRLEAIVSDVASDVDLMRAHISREAHGVRSNATEIGNNAIWATLYTWGCIFACSIVIVLADHFWH